MKRTATAAGYVTSLLGMHSAFTAEGVLIGRYSLKRDALAAEPDMIAEFRIMLAAELMRDANDVQTVQRINSWDDEEIMEWANILTA